MTVSLTSCPAVRRRGPPPTSAHRPYGKGHHRTRGLGPLWREGAPGAGRPQDRHHLQRPAGTGRHAHQRGALRGREEQGHPARPEETPPPPPPPLPPQPPPPPHPAPAPP